MFGAVREDGGVTVEEARGAGRMAALRRETFSALSIPNFIIGIFLIWLFAVRWNLLPASNWNRLSDGVGANLQTAILPAVALALAAYGLLIELLQGLTRTRQAEELDLVADVAGILLGWLLSTAGLSRWCTKLESWLARPNP